MKITVILCTYNRCLSLGRALASVSSSIVPKSVEWDVLVVDNNSHDQTRAVIEEYCRRYPDRFRYLFEAHPGKSYALNSAIRETEADVLAFMDDDVEVDPNWLCNLTAPLSNEEWAGSGGRILPEVAFTPPSWLETSGRYSLAPLAMFDLGFEPGELREAPFGTNMAFRKSVFSKYGDFRTDLGPQPGSQIRSEDTEFGARVLRAGERLWYEPSALVLHSVSQDRVRQEYFLAWWFDKARADIREYGIPPGTRWYCAGVPLYLFRRLCVWTLKWIFSFGAKRRFSCKLKTFSVVAMIKESHRLSLERVQSVGNGSPIISSIPRTPPE
jgi:glycosyltransferase involved in cell wall biosynthesis